MKVEAKKIHNLERLIKKIKANKGLSEKEVEQLSDASAHLLFAARASRFERALSN